MNNRHAVKKQGRKTMNWGKKLLYEHKQLWCFPTWSLISLLSWNCNFMGCLMRVATWHERMRCEKYRVATWHERMRCEKYRVDTWHERMRYEKYRVATWHERMRCEKYRQLIFMWDCDVTRAMVQRSIIFVSQLGLE